MKHLRRRTILQHAVADVAQSLLHFLHALRQLLLQAGHSWALIYVMLSVTRRPQATTAAPCAATALSCPTAVLL
jgi:hypothetical protein